MKERLQRCESETETCLKLAQTDQLKQPIAQIRPMRVSRNHHFKWDADENDGTDPSKVLGKMAIL